MKKTIKVLLLTIFALIGLSMISKVDAASASIKASKNPANVGDKVTITVTINAAAWNLKVSGSGVTAAYADNTDDLNNTTITKTLSLNTSAKGSKTVILSGDVTDQTGATKKINTSVSVVVNEKQTTPEPQPEPKPQPNTNTKPPVNNNQGGSTTQTPAKSSDTSLKYITVGGENYKSGTTKTVGADTTSITIKAVANSSKASVSGTGTKELVTGTNNFEVKVTAENGSTKVYKITVIREELIEDNPNIEDPNKVNLIDNLRLTSLKVEGLELTPQFNSETFDYSVYVINKEEIEVSAISNKDDAKIEITGNKGLVEGKNTVTIKITKDEETVEYRITVNRSIVEEKEESKVGFIGSISNWWHNSGSTIIVFTIILILLGTSTIFAILSYKYGNNARSYSKHGMERGNIFNDNDN